MRGAMVVRAAVGGKGRTSAASPPPGGEGLADDALATRAAAGDRTAWAALVDRHLAGVSGYAWYMLGDRAEAEDIAQETFLRLMAKLPDWQAAESRADGAQLRTWLYRVTINLCIDRQRKHVPEPMADLPDMPDGQAARAEENFDRARVVRAALDRLPERQRAVMALVYYQGFTNVEAAGLLKVSVEAVESLLGRARRALRASLAPMRDDLLGRT